MPHLPAKILVPATAFLLVGGAVGAIHARQSGDGITSAAKDARSTTGVTRLESFDLVWTNVERRGTHLVFTERVASAAGAVRPTRSGGLAGSSVFSYVWPVSLDPSTVGFEGKSGILALAATAHPDFDDTPKYDENGDGDVSNDGDLWHSHWVVLVADESCGRGALKVRDIPAGASPRLPATWPGLPLYIDSPGYDPEIAGDFVRVKVPLKELGFPSEFRFDGVTAALKVNASVHDPLLCVADVFDVASGSLSLPGTVR